jgi:hypothetical protein
MSDQVVDVPPARRVAQLQGEVRVLREHIRMMQEKLLIAVGALGAIADRGGEDWQVADRALTRMTEVE